MCNKHSRHEYKPFTFPPEAPLPLIPSKWEAVSESLYALAALLVVGLGIAYYAFR